MNKRALRIGGALLAVVAIAAFAGFSSDGSAGPEEKAEAAPRSGKEIISTLKLQAVRSKLRSKLRIL